MRGRGGKRGGGATSRGWIPGQADKLAETSRDLGLVALATQVDAPPPLFPERVLRKFVWSDPDGSEEWRVMHSEEMRQDFASSAFNLDAPAAPGALSGSRRLFAALGDVLLSDAFPLELVVAKSRAAAARSTAHGRSASARRGGEAAVEFERAAKKAARANVTAGGSVPATAGAEGEDAFAGIDADADDDEGEEDAEEEEEDEDDEDFNDYTDIHEDDDGDDGDGDGGGADY